MSVVPTEPLQEPSTPAPLSERPTEDLGFGRVVAQQVRGRFLSRDGTPNSRKYGLGPQRLDRFYQHALKASWPQFLIWSVGVMLLVNGLFAMAYTALGPGVLQGQEQIGVSDAFLRAFAFSVGIFTTAGTGPMYAVGPTATWLVVFESLLGPLVMLGLGGLLVARITRPRMQVRFSESAIIAPFRDGRALMFRMVNVKPGELSDVQVRMTLVWFEDVNGKGERRFHQLELERSSVEFFTLHWTVVHPITASSPLRGITPERLHEAQAEILVHVRAHEGTFSTHVTSRMSYLWEEVRWDVKFADIFMHSHEDVIAIDVERLDRTDQLPEGSTATPAALETVA